MKLKVYVEHQQPFLPMCLHTIEKVTDWEDRIKAYDQKTKDLYRKCFGMEEKMLKLMSGEKKMPWRVHIDDKRRDLFLELTDTEEGFPLLRAESTQPVDVLTAFRTYCHSPNRQIYDPNVAQCDYIQ